jgi:hypothetical protein
MKHVWIPIVIALILWIISAMARSAKAKEKEKEKPVEPNQGRPPRRRPSSADIDRFLEEVKRRQMEQRRRQAEPPAVEPVIVVEPAPRPKPPPVRRPPLRRAEPVLVAEAIPVAVPVEAARRPEIVSAPEMPRAKLPDHVVELERLLRSPQGLRTAFVLNEILGPPRCKRGRRR